MILKSSVKPIPLRQLAIAAFLVTLFFPSSATIISESPKLTFSRAFYLLVAIPALMTLFARWRAGTKRVALADIFVFVTSVSMLAAVSISNGIRAALISGGVQVLELAIPYYIVRALINEEDVDFYVLTFQRVFLVLVILGLVDIISGDNWVQKSTAKLFNVDIPYWQPPRFGLIRAMSTLDHAIHFGILSSFSLALFTFYCEGTIRRVFWSALATIGCAISLSSSALLLWLLVSLAYVYSAVYRRLHQKWVLLIIAIAYGVFGVIIFVENPIKVLIGDLTLEPETGFYRLEIWHYAGASVLSHPWVGIGFVEWDRPSYMHFTIDAIWLWWALTYGIPSLICLLLTFASALFPGRNQNSTYSHHGLNAAITLILWLSILSGFSVHYWGTLWSFILSLMALRINTADRISSSER